MKRYCVLLWLFACLGAPAYSQRITASLGGTVRDPSGAAVPGAAVRIVNADTGVPVDQKTDQEGHFLAPSLVPGPYNIQIEAAGFKRLARKGIILVVEQNAQVDFSLELGATTDTVEVTGEAPLLDTASASMGQVINAQSIVNLPLVDRNPFSLIMLSAGVSGAVGTNFKGIQFSVNGSRSGSTDLLLDGVPSAPPTDNFNTMTSFPSVDAIQEFKVQTGGYSAEFGMSGAGIINLVYKSGTNTFHGTLYEFIRNSKLDANSFFSNRNGRPLVNYKRNQFGGVIGGPVILPKVYDGHNRTFFFFTYEGLRQRTAADTTTSVPTAEERLGDFSQIKTSTGLPITIYDPLTTTLVGTTYTRQVFAGNKIPLARFDRVASNIIKYFPMPNAVPTNGHQINNFYAAAPAPYSINQWDLKGDETLSEKQRISLRFSRRTPLTAGAKFFPDDLLFVQNRNDTTENSVSGALNYTYTARPTFLVEFRWGITHVNRMWIASGEGYDPTQLGFPSYIRETANRLAFPGLAPAGYVGIGQGSQTSDGALGMMIQTWALSATKVFSRHTVKFGAEMRLLANNVDQEGGSTGNFNFPANFTQGPNAQSASATAGDGFASYLLGLGAGTLTHNFKIVDTISKYWGAYIQDDWKVRSKLTLNVGLRYELYLPRTERHDRMNLLDTTTTSPLAAKAGMPNLVGGLQFPGVNGFARTQFDTPWLDFAPRFGFAYQANQRVVLRGGYGIYFGPAATAAAATVNQTGWYAASTLLGTIDGVTPNNYLSDPFPGGSFVPVTRSSLGMMTATGTGITAPLYHSPTPYTQNATLGAQVQLPGNWVVEGSFVGTRGVKLIYTQNYMQLPLDYMKMGPDLLKTVKNPFYGLITNAGALAGATVQQRYLMTRFPQFTGFNAGNYPGASSLYYAIQMRAEKRFSRGFWVLLSYTGSRMFDDSSVTNGNTAPYGNGTTQDALNRHSDWGLSTADVSSRMVASFIYNLPFGRNQRFGSNWNRWLHGVLGGWQANGIATFETGQPLTLSANNQSNIFTPGSRPNNSGASGALSGDIHNRLLAYFNTATFSQPALYTIGNVSRTLPDIRTPGGQNFDLSLFKEFKPLERYTIQFRAETFNALNWVRFGSPQTSVISATFGQITSQANTPRMYQFALKVLF